MTQRTRRNACSRSVDEDDALEPLARTIAQARKLDLRRNVVDAVVAMSTSWVRGVLGGALALAALGRTADARPEDLKRQIESQQQSVPDLERLDTRRGASDELVLLRAWLDEAWGQFAKEDYDRVREILDRVVAQAELCRQKITAANMAAQANDKEAALRATRDKLARTKQALEQAMIKKKALEMNK
jgi:hypothetical protein